jgi:glyoxylase-like metal-dependent hydrolase (beta-lactamase superfamily II)
LIQQDNAQSVGEHSYVILDDNVAFVPNVGIVVGSRATLVIDTGMGERNGRVVLEEARKLSSNGEFYVTATHYHPEHDLGAEAFPANARLVRWSGQQAEIDAAGTDTIARFSSFSPVVAELLDGVAYRTADILFEDDIRLDLGGVHVRVLGVGPNHTLGDTVFFVEEDRVLFTGDVVMPVFPAVSGTSGSIVKWIDNIHRFEAMQPETVVPAHGRLLGADSLPLYRRYFTAVQHGVGELRRSGVSVSEGVESLVERLVAQFPELAPANGSPAGRIRAAIDAAAREIPQAARSRQ